MQELPIIQKIYDLTKGYVPILNHLPHDHKLILGERMVYRLYDLLEILVQVCYSPQSLPGLE